MPYYTKALPNLRLLRKRPAPGVKVIGGIDRGFLILQQQFEREQCPPENQLGRVTYPVSHVWEDVPIVDEADLDKEMT